MPQRKKLNIYMQQVGPSCSLAGSLTPAETKGADSLTAGSQTDETEG